MMWWCECKELSYIYIFHTVSGQVLVVGWGSHLAHNKKEKGHHPIPVGGTLIVKGRPDNTNSCGDGLYISHTDLYSVINMVDRTSTFSQSRMYHSFGRFKFCFRRPMLGKYEACFNVLCLTWDSIFPALVLVRDRVRITEITSLVVNLWFCSCVKQ